MRLVLLFCNILKTCDMFERATARTNTEMDTKNQQLESEPPRNELQQNEFSSEKPVTFEDTGTQCYFIEETRENYKLIVATVRAMEI
jgi:hypothetical protein